MMTGKSKSFIWKNTLLKSAGVILLLVFSLALNIYANNTDKNKKAVTINYKITVVDSSENTPLAFAVLILKRGMSSSM